MKVMNEKMHKDTECEECTERSKTVENVMRKLKESEITSSGKKKNLESLFGSVHRFGENLLSEGENQNQIIAIVLTIKI